MPQLGDIKKSTPIVETHRPLFQVSTPEARTDVSPPVLPDRILQLPELCLSGHSSASNHFSSPRESLQNDLSSEHLRSHGLVGQDAYEITQKPCLELHRADITRPTARHSQFDHF
jgi:hypothetical protein